VQIAIDISRLHSMSTFRGIGMYTSSLFEALTRFDGDNEYTLIHSRESMDRFDLIHYPYFDFYFLTLPLVPKKPTIVTIHDVVPLVYKRAYPAGLRGEAKFFLQKLALNSVSQIVTDSNQSTNDVIRYLNQPKEKVATVYLAADERYVPQSTKTVATVIEKYSLSTPYLLYVGDINFNKNLPALVVAFSKLATPHTLVLVSKALHHNNPAATPLLTLIDSMNLAHRIRILSAVPPLPEPDLPALYGGAEWYIQPSLYEGFGLPVLEAMACGAPVISSIGGSLAEVASEAAITFDPIVDGSMETALHMATSLKKGQRSAYIQKGLVHAQGFSWKQTAAQMKGIYEASI
jgi:glycosyltransferase involved in cell wall biosynthesis